MTNKILPIALGFILIFGGIFYFFREVIPVSFGAVCSVVLGAAFTIAYFKNSRKWTILPGIYLLYMGLAVIFFSGSSIYSHVVTTVFFLAPGTIFIILYYTTDKRPLLLTIGLILAALGICVLLSGLFDFNYINIFMLCIGISFVLNYILKGDYSTRTSLVIGVIFIFLSLRKLLSVSPYGDAVIAMALVILGFIVIVRTLLNK